MSKFGLFLVIFVFICASVIFYLYRELCADYEALEKKISTPVRKVEPQSLSLAFQNKNPLNVKAVAGGWNGQIGVDKFGHARFVSWEHGMRAASIVLKNYAQRHNIDTVAAVVARFAEGNRKEYAAFVSCKLGVKPDQKIDIIRMIPELLRAMARFECGRELPETLFVPYDILAKI